MKIFIMATKECKSPPVMEAIILPCLNIICGLIKPDPPTSKKNKVFRVLFYNSFIQ